MRYSAFTYPTPNIGDFIQTLAAMQYLPRVDYFVNREHMALSQEEEPSFLIANAWYLHNVSHFPPPPNLHPFYISMHIAHEAILTEEGIRHLKQHEPIGCRDRATATLLQSKGIVSYFSKDITLTLSNPFQKRGDAIYLVGFEEYYASLLDIIPQTLRETSTSLSHFVLPDLSQEGDCPIPEEVTQAKLKKAQSLIDLYAQAKLVITTKLHCAVTCNALGTPVLLIYENRHEPNYSRFETLEDLVPRYFPGKPKGATTDSPIDFRSQEEIDWNPKSIPCQHEKKVLSWLCREAVKRHDNPLKAHTGKLRTIKDRIPTLQDIELLLMGRRE